MGKFYFSSDVKQHINLNAQTWDIINQDLLYFENIKLTTLLNLIIEKFASVANASIELRLEHLRLELIDIIKDYNDKIDKDKFIDYMLKYERTKATNEISTAKGEYYKLKINKANCDYLMNECKEADNYPSLGSYLKNLFEDYASLPLIKREEVICSEICETIYEAIELQKTVVISVNTKIHTVKPIRIVPNKINSFNYLLGIDTNNKMLLTFRIKRIATIKKGNKFVFTSEEKEQIKNTEKAIDPEFIINDESIVKMRLTTKGIKQYNNAFYNKPNYVRIEDDNIYVFLASQFQIEIFFRRFGKDAICLYPPELVTKFQRFYRSAAFSYK